MKLSLLIPTLGVPFFAFVACGQVQEQTPAATKSTASSTATTTPAPPTPTTTATTTPVTPPPAGKIIFPQAQSSGGKVITAPKVVPVVFAQDTLAPKISEFHQKLAVSQYWKDIATEYGISPITALDMVVLDEAPPTTTTDDDIQVWLRTKLEAEGGPLGAPDSDTMYAIYYPTGTSITLDGERSCRSFGGYHSETTAGGIPVSYGIMPRCNGGGGMSSLESLTVAASHEVFEWATDPYPFTDPAFQGMARDFKTWEWAFMGELGDLCSYLDYSGRLEPDEIGYRVQRMWSNKNAAAGHNPCAPKPDDAYFVGVPMVKDNVSIQGMTTKGVAVKVGETVDLPIQFYSDEANGAAWDIQVIDSGQLTGQSFSNGAIQYNIAKDTGKNGEVTTVSITSTAADYSLFLVVATRDGEQHMWPGIVVAKK